MEKFPRDKKIILFDGVCNLCDTTVQKVIKADKSDQFRFAALQSEIGKEILTHIGVDPQKTDSMILYIPGHAYYIKSQAALKIASYLKGPYILLQPFSVLPSSLTDKLYDYVAKNRYSWYGKKQSCMVPTDQIKQKFL